MSTNDRMRAALAGMVGCMVALLAAAMGGPDARAARDGGTDTPRANLARVDADAAHIGALHLVVPVQGVRRHELRDTYRAARGEGEHEAIDIPAARGTPVIAAADGRIVKLFRSIPGGLTLYQFDREARFALYYAHLDAYAPDIREGLDVAQGKVIGFVGTSGNAPPDAPHLHFALFKLGPEKRWWQGTPVNPFPFLASP